MVAGLALILLLAVSGLFIAVFLAVFSVAMIISGVVGLVGVFMAWGLGAPQRSLWWGAAKWSAVTLGGIVLLIASGCFLFSVLL